MKASRHVAIAAAARTAPERVSLVDLNFLYVGLVDKPAVLCVDYYNFVFVSLSEVRAIM